jgi:hypothetical protein
MTLLALDGPPPPDLAARLLAFEAQFRYPLGAGRRFRIDHGPDPTRFFRSLGPAVGIVDEHEGAIRGVIGAALRQICLPGGEVRNAVYVGDLKLDPRARGGRTLVRLATAVREWAAGRAACAFSVVMGGTPASPQQYTGRLAIPAFAPIGEIAVLRLPTAGATGAQRADDKWLATAAAAQACRLALCASRCCCQGGEPSLRSELSPVDLVAPDGAACGRLEDTRRAKRLIADDGTEMLSAHVSGLAYADTPAAAALIEVARRRAAALGLPALFVAVPVEDAEPLCSRLPPDTVRAPATVYGHGLERGTWNIDTACI